MRSVLSIIVLTAFATAIASTKVNAANPDGGMYPIDMVHKLPLKKAGLRITGNDIYNPNGTGLLQAIVQIGGCTGSFVSGQGLIVTNHHCAFGSLAPYSNPVNNLFEKGYLAKSRKEELPMKGLSCKLMVSQKDVSFEVMAGTDTITDGIRKRAAIAKNMDKVKQLAVLSDNAFEWEVSEMLPGKSYFLSCYMVIKDLRIVYIPPRDIGEFGGETDNWVWPRHTGDFSFIRAYVAKSGKGAGYDTSNVPYEPKEYLNISTANISAGDFVFVLGYPGKTDRQEPAAFLKYQQDYQLPFISELYNWQIDAMIALGKSDSIYGVSMQPKIKSLANVMKNYKGKLQGITKLDLYQKKKADDLAFADKIKDPLTRGKYLKTLNKIDSVYAVAEKEYWKYSWYNRLLTDDYFVKISHLVADYTEIVSKNKNPVPEVIAPYLKLLRGYYKSMYIRFDTMYFAKMLRDARGFDEANRPLGLGDVGKGKKKDILMALAGTKLLDSTYLFDVMVNKPAKLLKMKDPFVTLAHYWYIDEKRLDSIENICKQEIDVLTTDYIDIKINAIQEDFLPDANHTLRFSYGYVKGYTPRDGVFCPPFTTVNGMIEKNGENPDYKADDSIIKIIRQNVKNRIAANEDVPLCLLYDTDTTGGNSGSPVFNEYGQLIALNFDRNYEATINDYAWDEKYSRSIGVDMRFVIWELTNVAKAKNILAEMFIDNGR